jgi:hypothetical protein
MDNVNSMITELLILIDRKKQLFDDIMEITLQQKSDIEKNAAVNIEELVNEKQTMIDSVDEIDRTFSGLVELLKKQLQVDSLEKADLAKYPELKAIKPKVEEIMSLAQKIMEIELSNKEKLTSIMDEMKKEMRQMSVGRRSIKAYEGPAINNDGIFVDKKK